MRFLGLVNILCCLFVGLVINILLYGWVNQRFPNFYRYVGAGWTSLCILNILYETVIKREIELLVDDVENKEE